MGFQEPDLNVARVAIGACLVEIRSPYNDGWTSQACKRELYLLKSWLDAEYKKLPTFSEEIQWNQERMWNTLKDDK